MESSATEQPAASIAKRALVPLVVALFAWGHLSQRAFHWDCPIRSIAHVPCPTCGMSGAARAMLHLDFAGATRTHPLALVVIPYVALLVTWELAAYVATGQFGTFLKGDGKMKNAVRIAGLAMCAALFVVWVARFFGAFGGPQRV